MFLIICFPTAIAIKTTAWITCPVVAIEFVWCLGLLDSVIYRCSLVRRLCRRLIRVGRVWALLQPWFVACMYMCYRWVLLSQCVYLLLMLLRVVSCYVIGNYRFTRFIVIEICCIMSVLFCRFVLVLFVWERQTKGVLLRWRHVSAVRLQSCLVYKYLSFDKYIEHVEHVKIVVSLPCESTIFC